MNETDKTSSRRDFLKLAGAGAPAAAIASVAGPAAEADEVASAGTGLRKTEHVRKYLDTARF